MAWGGIIGRSTAKGLKVDINPYIVLFLAAIPDIDLLLGITGIRHRTWTHSILIWALIFVPFFIMYKRKSIPYFLAPIQHILFGDFIVGHYNSPLWPVSSIRFSLDYGLLSYENLSIEAVGLAGFVIWTIVSRRTREQFLAKTKKNLWAILPIVPLVAFVTAALSGNLITSFLIEHNIVRAKGLLESLNSIQSNALFPFAVSLHIILLAFLLVPLIQALRSSSKTKVSMQNAGG